MMPEASQISGSAVAVHALTHIALPALTTTDFHSSIAQLIGGGLADKRLGAISGSKALWISSSGHVLEAFPSQICVLSALSERIQPLILQEWPL